MHRVLSHKSLTNTRGVDFFHALVVRVVGAHHEEHILVGVFDFAKGRHQRRAIAVADIIFAPVREVGAIVLTLQDHTGGVDVGPMGAFTQAKGKDTALLKKCGCLLFHPFVGAHPDRAQTQNGDLPGVPIAESIKPENLVVLTDAPHVPT